ncbi:TRAP-type C4-dicarboxylate transport system, substrate-binding protein [Roseovarius pacificus]|uniref:TRAP-type C4-dicarboxylate transport system, substrate-binding protein n=1 Tax=Roseovarius pacificus TaxID=337701 RepID=A0A1M7ESJ0_9RHOB|nr:TRAP transporter substrate-binding protein DctP [Roseovarius pacificus]GGO57527.1 C4-dicarboxylate ABC transporter [Roseovarius pacificus]SHL94546.1 TRAP-type C4-dicarboxylate transport system, substrate-binding protein [Roseovarius pacificus]
MKRTILTSIAALAVSSATAFAADIELKVTTDSGFSDSPSGIAIANWAKAIEEGSDGEIEVQVFYQDELGTQLEVFDLFVAGEVDLMLAWPSTTYDKRIGVVTTPFMVSSWEEATEALRPDGWANSIINDVFAGIGLKYLGAWPEGFAGVATRGKYATTIDGASDIKVRTAPYFPNPESLQAMGYQTEVIEWGETYTSIQTGLVDGDSGNVIYWDYEYFGDLLDYFVHTKHKFGTGSILANLNNFEELSEEHQALIVETAETMMEEQFASARAEDQRNIERAVADGMEYIELTEEESAALKEAVRTQVWPLIEESVGSEIMEQIRAHAK